MLNKNCKIILDTLIKNNFTYPQSKFISIEATLIPLLPKGKNIEWSVNSITPLLQYLKSIGYVDYVTTTNGYNPVFNCTMLYTTYPGTYYKQFKWLKFEDFILKSILTPIALSVITTIITILIAG